MMIPRLVVVFVVLAFATAHTARADNTAQLIGQLGSDSKNVRLAAAVNLAKQSDPRIILPFVKLMNDDEAQIRSVAANGLGRMVNKSTSPSLYNLTVKVLTTAADQDASDDVKRQAAAALAQVTGKASAAPTPNAPTGPGAQGAAGGIYVNIGPMSSKTGGPDDAKLREIMVKTAGKALAKAEPKYMQNWPGGGAPSRVALDKQKVAGFYVDGTLNEVTAKDSGSDSTISCKVSMLLASYPEKSVFGFLNGGAKVSGSSSPSEKALARQDCVDAVIADLITKKIIPTIKTKVP